jgi:hypothetical protein
MYNYRLVLHISAFIGHIKGPIWETKIVVASYVRCTILELSTEVYNI